MSGSTNAALNASASMPRPKSQAIYLTRASPMMRDRKADAISTRVAVKAVCAYDGRSNPAARDHLVRTGGAGSVEGLPATEVDSTGVVRLAVAKKSSIHANAGDLRLKR